jgi:hypothetical protein
LFGVPYEGKNDPQSPDNLQFFQLSSHGNSLLYFIHSYSLNQWMSWSLITVWPQITQHLFKISLIYSIFLALIWYINCIRNWHLDLWMKFYFTTTNDVSRPIT